MVIDRPGLDIKSDLPMTDGFSVKAVYAVRNVNKLPCTLPARV
jgi:hypothetical protein